MQSLFMGSTGTGYPWKFETMETILLLETYTLVSVQQPGSLRGKGI